MDPVDLIIASLEVKGAFPNTPWLLLEAVWKRLGLPFYNFASGYIRTRKYRVRTGGGLTPFLEPGSGVPQGGAEGPFLYLLVTLPLALAIEHDYPAYAPYSLLSPLVGFADDTNLTVAHTPHEPHAPDPGLMVTQQVNDLLDVTVSYLSHNNLIVHPTMSVAMIKGSATPPTLGPQGPPMQVVTATTHLGVIQAANPEEATLPPKLQSHLAHLSRYASPTTKALSLSHQSLAYYLTRVLNASIGFQALHLTHPTTALQPATRAVTTACTAHGGWPTSIPTRAIRAAWPHYGDTIGDEVKAAYTRHTALLLHRMTHNHSLEVREVTTIRLQAAERARNTCPRWVLHQTGMPTNMNMRLWNHLQLPPIPTPRHTHQPHVPRGRASSGPLRGPPPSPQGHHPHHRPCRGLHHRSIRHPPPNAGPAPQRGTLHPLSTASRMASIPPLPPVPQADGTSSGTHSAGKQRHANSLPRVHKATPPAHPSDTALRTHRLETRTRPPGDRPSPTTNPTTGPE